MISRSERAIEDGGNSMASETLSFSDVQNRDSSKASGISLGVNVGRNQSGNMFSLGMAPGMGKVSESQGGTTRGGISVAAVTVGDKQALARLPERAGQHLALVKSPGTQVHRNRNRQWEAALTKRWPSARWCCT